MAVTVPQGNAILDLYEQCALVAQAHEQLTTHAAFMERWEATPRSERKSKFGLETAEVKAMAKDVSDNFKAARDRLTYLYCQAEELGVDSGLLDNIIALELSSLRSNQGSCSLNG